MIGEMDGGNKESKKKKTPLFFQEIKRKKGLEIVVPLDEFILFPGEAKEISFTSEEFASLTGSVENSSSQTKSFEVIYFPSESKTTFSFGK